MQILINQQPFTINDSLSLDQIPQLIQAKQPYAIAVNKIFIPKSEYANVVLKDNDMIEIISPITGG